MIGMCSGVVFYYLLVPSLHEIRGRVRLKKEPDISENTVIPIKEEELSMDPDISDYKDVRVHDLNEDKHQHHGKQSSCYNAMRSTATLTVSLYAKTCQTHVSLYCNRHAKLFDISALSQGMLVLTDTTFQYRNYLPLYLYSRGVAFI